MTIHSNPPPESWRVFFPLAAALALAGLLAWAGALAGLAVGLGAADHAALMLWGAFGSGIQGFLMTAYAKQNGAPLPSRARLAAQLTAQLVAATALVAPALVPVGPARAALLALPWVTLLAWAVPVARASLARAWEATTATVPAALAAGLVGAALHGLGSTGPRGLDVGAHPFVSLLALAILDRVLPFFSGRVTPGYVGVRRPWFLGPLAALLWARVLVPAALPAVDLLLLGLLGRQWAGWAPWPAARTPAIAAIHLGVAWFAVAWVLEFSGVPARIAVHAQLVGGLGTLLLALATRVAQGHSGRPIALGRAGVLVLALAQLAAGLRVVGALVDPGPTTWIPAALLLAGAFAVWLFRFGPLAAPRG